jgi:hypothetical protein
MRKFKSNIVDAQVKLIKSEPGKLTVRLLGVGFGSKDHRDLDGEFFTKETNFNDEIFQVKGVNYDHNPPSWMANPYGSHELRTEFIGTGKLVETTDAGRWYELEIMKAEEYHEFFMKLINKGFMGASTQSVPGTVTTLPSGEITAWPEVAMALTVQPANPDTIGTINEMAKSFNIPLFPTIQFTGDSEFAKAVKEFPEKLETASRGLNAATYVLTTVGKVNNSNGIPPKSRIPAPDDVNSGASKEDDSEKILVKTGGGLPASFDL